MEDLENQIIDSAFRHVANNEITRKLKEGLSWGNAFGLGGGPNPVSWMGNANGITYGENQISVAKIMARLNKEQPQVGQLNLF